MRRKKDLIRKAGEITWLLVFLLGVVKIAYLGDSYRNQSIEKRRSILEADFKKSSDILSERIHKFRFGLQGLAGLYYVENYRPLPQQVRRLAASRKFYDNFEGAFGFGFIRRVPRKELAAYEGSYAKLVPGFNVHGVPASNFSQGTDAFVIESIEPSERNLPAIGLDVASEKNRFEAALQAGKSGKTTLTRRINLVQRDSAGAGFLLFHPVYRTTEIPATEHERWRSLVGWAYTPVLMRSLFESVAREEEGVLELRILQQEPSGDLELFRSANWDAREKQILFKNEIQAFERPWVIEGRAAKALWQMEDTIFLYSTCALASLGLGLALLFFRALLRSHTHAKTNYRRLELSQRAILDNADFAIITTDPHGLITDINASGVKLFGFASEELINRIKLENFHNAPEAAGATSAAFSGLLQEAKEGRVQKAAWTYEKKDGRQFPGLLNLKAIMDEEKELVGFVAIVQDITEKKAAEAKMVQTAKLASLGEMAGGIAHEVNNPLAMIKGKASVLLIHLDKGNPDPIKMRSELEKISSVVDRIATIISGLRSFSRDASHEGLKNARLSGVLSDAISLCRQRFQAHGVDLRLVVEDELEAECRPIQLAQALLNLLNNSHDAVMGSSSPWLEVRLKRQGDRARIEVTDSGNGIPTDLVPKIMQPFFTTKEVGKGMGLGLSTSLGLVESQRGRLFYDATSANTKFVIELPEARSI